MLETVYSKIGYALNTLREGSLPVADRLDLYGRTLGEALLAMEITPATVLACVRAIRNRLEAVQALERPHPLDTVRAVTLEILQEVPETALLFQQRMTLPHAWRGQPTHRLQVRTPFHAAPEHRHAGERVRQRLSFDRFRGFEPCASFQPLDAYKSLDREGFRQHLRRIRRRPEPPAGGSRGVNHV